MTRPTSQQIEAAAGVLYIIVTAAWAAAAVSTIIQWVQQ